MSIASALLLASAVLVVKPVSGQTNDGLLVHIENASDHDVENVTLSLTLAKDDGVSIESRFELRALPARGTVPATIWVPGGHAAAQIQSVRVARPRAVRVELRAPQRATRVAH